MDKKIKEKWMNALRSGEYEQGNNALRYQNRYCCLGVLCDIIDLPSENCGWEIEDGVGTFYWEIKKGMTYHSNTRIPDCLRGVIGLSAGDENVLIGMNDRLKRTFNEIADWIDINL